MAVYQSDNKALNGEVFGCIAKDGQIKIADSDVAALEPLLVKFYACKRVDNADTNNDGKLTMEEIKAKLDELGIEYPVKAKKAVLMAMYNEQVA